jgi:hypothetical protein
LICSLEPLPSWSWRAPYLNGRRVVIDATESCFAAIQLTNTVPGRSN